MENLRMPFSAVTYINTPYLQAPQNKSDKSKQQIVGKDSDGHKFEDKKKSQIVQDDQIETLEKEQLIILVKQYKNVISTCFDENDTLRDRLSKLEALYSAAQDEIELRDKVIEELAAIVSKLNTDDKEEN